MKDAVATMGAILPDDAGGRDAVHVAVISVIAGQTLSAGVNVGFKTPQILPGEQEVFADGAPIGIVDPFIQGYVDKGQRFWLYLYPRTITSLRHEWTHPAFTNDASIIYNPPNQRLEAEKWIRNFIAISDCPQYEILMEKATKVADGVWNREYLHFNDTDAHGDIPSEFWDKVEIVLGRKIKGNKPAYFSCSC